MNGTLPFTVAVQLRSIFRPVVLLLVLGVVHVRGLQWWWTGLAGGESTLHAVVVAAVVAGVVGDLRRRGRLPSLQPVAGGWGGMLLSLSIVGHWSTAPLQLGVLDAAWVWVALVGLVAWMGGVGALRRGAVPLVLLALVLPRLGHLEALVGVPLRLVTAHGVASVLSAMGWAAVDQGTVLVVEGKSTALDLPCSGVRSLWTGLAFFLGAAWLDRRRFGLSVALLGMGLAGALVGANAARVLVLVVLARGGLPHGELVAAVLHEPMGLVGFVVACGMAWGALRWTPPLDPSKQPVVHPSGPPRGQVLWGLIVALGLAAHLLPRADAAAVPSMLAPPPGMVTVEPSAAERDRVAQHRGRLSKARWSRGSLTGAAAALSGEVVLVWGATVRAQHRPDICLRSTGATVGVVVPAEIDGRDVRTAEVSTLDGPARLVWWFQAADRSTGSHSARMFAGVGSTAPWVLVSVLVREGSQVPDIDDPGLDAVLDHLGSHAHRILEPSSALLETE